MTLFRIERGQSLLSSEEAEVAALRALLCALGYPGMRWVRSFVAEPDNTVRCFYEARRTTDIEFHSRVAGIPCLAVRPVTEVRPSASGKVLLGGVDTGKDTAAGDVPVWIVRQRLDGRTDAEVIVALPRCGDGVPRWVRTFIDREGEELLSAYRAHSESSLLDLLAPSPFPVIEARRADEYLPSDLETAKYSLPNPYGTASRGALVALDTVRQASTGPQPQPSRRRTHALSGR